MSVPRWLRVRSGHRPSSGGDRLWWGRAALAILLLGRVVTLTSGCSPPAGAEGGQCEGDGCNPYCDAGLVCSGNNSCVRAPIASTQPTAPYGCSLVAPVAPCDPEQHAYTCVGGATPYPYGEAPDASGCTIALDDGGNTSYCCNVTRCFAGDPQCASPSITVFCSDPWTPEESGADGAASLGCVALGPGTGGNDYCCAPPDVCFAGPTQYLTIPCSGPDAQVFCTGAASPAGFACAPQGILYGGDGVRGYCCEGDAGYAPTDAGMGGIDAGDGE